jgi:hypothetical protein
LSDGKVDVLVALLFSVVGFQEEDHKLSLYLWYQLPKEFVLFLICLEDEMLGKDVEIIWKMKGRREQS